MDDARDLQTQKAQELANLREAQDAQNQAIAERKERVERETNIASLYSNGYTSASEILDMMNVNSAGEIVGSVTLEQVEAALKIINPPDALNGLDSDYRTFSHLKSINDPAVAGMDFIDYQRAMANLKAISSGAGASTGEERTMAKLSQFAQVFVPGATIEIPSKDNPEVMEEIFVIGTDDEYANPVAFNQALSEAQQMNLSREDFINEFGYLINPAQPNNPEYVQYNITLPEFQRATGYTPDVAGQSKTGEDLTIAE
jgi:hypothetical protein